MAVELSALSFAAADPAALAGFWAGLLGWTTGDCDEVSPTDDTGFSLRFRPFDPPKVRPNRMHVDLTSESDDDQAEKVERALSLGARHLDIGQGPDPGHVVLADPEGNEFDVIDPGNNFLADCGFVGALACDGTRAVGTFWRDAWGWPFVWDEGEETAVRSPHGGPKITWGGPPIPPKDGPNRVRFELLVDAPAEVERLVALGARRIGEEPHGLVLADPDDNEFLVATR